MLPALTGGLAARVLPYLAGALVLALAYAIVDHRGYSRGRAEVIAESTRAAAREDARRAERAVVAEKARTEAKVQIKYVTRVITERIERYVPSTTPDLPGGFRVLHDAAARGVPAADPSGADGAPASAQAVTTTVAENYGTYHDVADKLRRLQQLIQEQELCRISQ